MATDLCVNRIGRVNAAHVYVNGERCYYCNAKPSPKAAVLSALEDALAHVARVTETDLQPHFVDTARYVAAYLVAHAHSHIGDE